jgi:hypothetical protein
MPDEPKNTVIGLQNPKFSHPLTERSQALYKELFLL